jgi:hypothetical protein
MSNMPLIPTISPDEYAEQQRERNQRWVAALSDPGYLYTDPVAERDGEQVCVLGFVLGMVEDETPEHPVQRTIWRARNIAASLLQRVVDTIDPTVRYL